MPDLMIVEGTRLSVSRRSDIHVDVDASYLMGKNNYFIRAAVYIDGKDMASAGPAESPYGRDALDGAGVQRQRRVARRRDRPGAPRRPGPGGLRAGADVWPDLYDFVAGVETGTLPGSGRVLDEATSKIGTGGDFVSIPPAKGSGLRLSGIVFQHDLGTDDHIVPAGRASVYSAGQVARFEFQIASSGSKLKVDRLAMRTRIFRDGVEVWQSAETPVETDATKTAGTFAKGALEVPKGLDPGKYMIRVEVSDKDTPGAAECLAVGEAHFEVVGDAGAQPRVS